MLSPGLLQAEGSINKDCHHYCHQPHHLLSPPPPFKEMDYIAIQQNMTW